MGEANCNFEENLISNIKKNILWVLENFYDSNQTLMAKALDVRVNTLNTYINGDTKPPITFLYKLSMENNLTLDSFVSEDLRSTYNKLKKKDMIKALYCKYEGKYYGYFYVVDSNSLKEGLVQEAIINIQADGTCDFKIESSEKSFNGALTVSDDLIYLDMKSSKEKINITFKNPGKNIKENYAGGLGIINISSPEDNRIPSAQKIILSKWKIHIEEYFNTLREFLNVTMYLKVKKRILIEGIKENLQEDRYLIIKAIIDDDKVSGEDKIILDMNKLSIIHSILTKEELIRLKEYLNRDDIFKDVLLVNSIKATLEDSKLVYRFIKNEFGRER